jgi:hypothetical protein
LSIEVHQVDLDHKKNGPEGPFFLAIEAFDQLRTGTA